VPAVVEARAHVDVDTAGGEAVKSAAALNAAQDALAAKLKLAASAVKKHTAALANAGTAVPDSWEEDDGGATEIAARRAALAEAEAGVQAARDKVTGLEHGHAVVMDKWAAARKRLDDAASALGHTKAAHAEGLRSAKAAAGEAAEAAERAKRLARTARKLRDRVKSASKLEGGDGIPVIDLAQGDLRAACGLDLPGLCADILARSDAAPHGGDDEGGSDGEQEDDGSGEDVADEPAARPRHGGSGGAAAGGAGRGHGSGDDEE
jgi:hypothetical protein